MSFTPDDDQKIDILFRATYENVAINIAEYCQSKNIYKDFGKYKSYADRLIDLGLVIYSDKENLRICITEKGEHIGKESSYIELIQKQKLAIDREDLKNEIKNELDKANLALAKRQLKTFWLSFLLAVLSLIISIISLLK